MFENGDAQKITSHMGRGEVKWVLPNKKKFCAEALRKGEYDVL